MFLKIVAKLMANPTLKKFFWKIWYEIMAKHLKLDDLRFMNYGYSADSFNTTTVPLDNEDESDRHCIQLYHKLLENCSPRDKHVLEIGSGRGGGVYYVKKYLGAAEATGIDLAHNAIEKSRETFTNDDLLYFQGSADKLPCLPEAFDLVMNVESSHCYPDMPAFLSEVQRVLKPGGRFAFTDFREVDDLPALRDQLKASGLNLLSEENITMDVLRAMKLDSASKEETIRAKMPKFLHKMLIAFAGTEASPIYQSFNNRNMEYRMFLLEKSS